MVTEMLSNQMAEVAGELAAMPRLLLGLDFDGTLAPIVSEPDHASMPDGTKNLLEALVARPGATVAVISGRSVDDLRTRVTQKAILAGNHGLEMLENGVHWRHPQAARYEAALGAICHELAAEFRGIPGALVEQKGLTASVHYRNATGADALRMSKRVRSALAPYDDSFLVRDGSKVIEILPAVAWNKGSAMLHILARMRRGSDTKIGVCYIGDDRTDEDAFVALTNAVTIRICQDCATAARFRVENRTQAVDFLARIAQGAIVPR
jgi:trehalose 6-phosphate phosphatase